MIVDSNQLNGSAILDTECLKIDLHEEQIRERSYAEQRKQQKKQPKLIEILSEETTNDNIGDVEKHELADKYVVHQPKA